MKVISALSHVASWSSIGTTTGEKQEETVFDSGSITPSFSTVLSNSTTLSISPVSDFESTDEIEIAFEAEEFTLHTDKIEIVFEAGEFQPLFSSDATSSAQEMSDCHCSTKDALALVKQILARVEKSMIQNELFVKHHQAMQQR